MMDKEKIFAEMEEYIKACHDNYRNCALCPKGKECVIPHWLLLDNQIIYKPFTWFSFKKTRQTELGKFLSTIKSICDDNNGDCSKCPLKYTHDFPVRSDCTFAHKPLYWLYAPVESKMVDVINEVNKKAVKFILQDDFGTIKSETANELKNKFNYDYTTNPRFPTIELEKIDDLRELESILLPVYGMIIDFYNIDGRAPGTPNLPRIFLYDGLIEGTSND